MATKLDKQITREAEINGTMYHVSLTPDPEPSLTYREKGTRGKGVSIPLSSLLKEDINLTAPVQYKNIGEVYMSAAEIKSKIAVSDREYKEKVAVLEAVDDFVKLAEWQADKNAPDSAIMDQKI
tara:strand:- start:4620 stop:4991 length:372 start_codon:yes stop_codon:yes gene_type:complete